MLASRGLGMSLNGSLVSSGMGIRIPIVVYSSTVPFSENNIFGYSGQVGKVIPIQRTAASITLSRHVLETLFGLVEVKGSAKITLLEEYIDSEVAAFKVSGAAKASLLAVSSDTEIGKLIVEGKYGISDEQLIAMILALLD